MPLLYGYLNPTSDAPCFLVPLFVEFPGSNRLLVQKISEDDLINSFFEMDIDRSCETTNESFDAQLNQPAFWAFRLNKDEVIQGNAHHVASLLGPYLRKHAFSKYPLIQSQVARFCGDIERHRQALALSFKMLTRHSPIIAEIWRDAVVIAPVARRELSSKARRKLTPEEIDKIRVVGHSSRLSIEIPSSAYDQVAGDSPPTLTETHKIADVFGLSGFYIVRRDLRDELIRTARRRDQFFGIVRSFSGTGFMIARSLNAVEDSGIIFPRSISRLEAKAIAANRKPLFVFAITNLATPNVEAALDFARKHDTGPIKVAIALQPLSFGVVRKGETVSPQLERLKGEFDYVFVIGNHILQRPYGDAPGLAASSKAIKYVRACIHTFIEMARADDGPISAAEFRTIFPLGFCLVGRAYRSWRDLSHSDLLKNAIGSTLNERLSLFDAKRLVIAGPQNIVKDAEVMNFVGDSAARTRDAVVTMESVESRQAITVLALGIELRGTSDLLFRNFCLRLLEFLGWEISDVRNSPLFVLGRRLESAPTRFGFLTRDGPIDDIVQAIQRRGKKEEAAILTNFKATPTLRAKCGSMGVWIFHYSLLEQYGDIRSGRKPGRYGLQ